MHCDYLLEFATLAREGTFPKAADRLGMSHACLRRHMKSLETELSVQLLDRTADGVTLTDVGRRVYAVALSIDDLVEEARAVASEQHRRAPITVYGLSHLPAYVAALNRACAQARWKGLPIEVRWTQLGRTPDLGGMGKESVLFCGCRSNPLLRELPAGWVSQEFLELGMVAIMEPTHPLAGRDVLRLDDLDGQLFIYASSDYDNALLYWEDVRAQFRRLGLRFRSMSYPLDSEADWGADLGAGILLMPAGYRAVDTERGRHKTVVPIEGITQTTLAAYRQDDELAAFVASIKLSLTE